jgi:MYXO-CTERM domain-containing protein
MSIDRTRASLGRFVVVLCVMAASPAYGSAQTGGSGATASAANQVPASQAPDTRDRDGGSKAGWLGLLGLAGLLGLRRREAPARRDTRTNYETGEPAGRR